MLKLFRKTEHKITIIAEFKTGVESEKAISNLSSYISFMVKPKDIIITQLLSIPSGYRITYNITYYTNVFIRRQYLKELSNLSDWLCRDKDCNGTLYKYHYNYV